MSPCSGIVPVLVAADVLGAGRIAQADANAIVVQAEARQHEEHQLDVGAIQRETWTKTPDGMRLKLVEEKEVLYLRKDGKPTGQ